MYGAKINNFWEMTKKNTRKVQDNIITRVGNNDTGDSMFFGHPHPNRSKHLYTQWL